MPAPPIHPGVPVLTSDADSSSSFALLRALLVLSPSINHFASTRAAGRSRALHCTRQPTVHRDTHDASAAARQVLRAPTGSCTQLCKTSATPCTCHAVLLPTLHALKACSRPTLGTAVCDQTVLVPLPPGFRQGTRPAVFMHFAVFHKHLSRHYLVSYPAGTETPTAHMYMLQHAPRAYQKVRAQTAHATCHVPHCALTGSCNRT